MIQAEKALIEELKMVQAKLLSSPPDADISPLRERIDALNEMLGTVQKQRYAFYTPEELVAHREHEQQFLDSLKRASDAEAEFPLSRAERFREWLSDFFSEHLIFCATVLFSILLLLAIFALRK